MDVQRAPTRSAGAPRGLAGWFGRPVHLEVRAPFEFRALRKSPLWRGEGVPAGEGRPLLLIPGFMAGRTTAEPLAHVLRAADWNVEVAAVGRNSGPAYHGMDACEDDLNELAASSGQPVTIIGHSRGGQFGRILAVRHPDLVHQVIVLGTPLLVKYPPFVVVKLPAEALDRAWRAGAFGHVEPNREQEVDDDRYQPFPHHIDFVSIWSKTDGIVDWRMSREPAAIDMKVSASHIGLISSIEGVEAVAAALTRQFPFVALRDTATIGTALDRTALDYTSLGRAAATRSKGSRPRVRRSWPLRSRRRSTR